MAIVQQLLINPAAKIIGFVGGKGRNYLANQLALELSRSGKKVIISSVGNEMLPTSGHIIHDKDENSLLERIGADSKIHSVIYGGLGVNDHFLEGINSKLARKIIRLEGIDFLLLFVETVQKISILNNKQIAHLSRSKLIEQLIYCFQLDLIDQAIDGDVVQDMDELFANFSKYRDRPTFSQQLICDYLVNKEKGAGNLFRQKWPASLVFTDVTNPLLENRAINLARDLFVSGIEYIYSANLKENLIKLVSPK